MHFDPRLSTLQRWLSYSTSPSVFLAKQTPQAIRISPTESGGLENFQFSFYYGMTHFVQFDT